MNRIRQLREAIGMQQKELAIALSVSQPTVSNWEAGTKVPSAKSMMKIAKFFSVSVEDVFGEETKTDSMQDAKIVEITDKIMALSEEDRQTAIQFIDYLNSQNGK